MATTFSDIEQLFHSMPLTKYEIPESLEAEWLKIAVCDYELNLGIDLGYNSETLEFSGVLSTLAQRTLAQSMYCSYLQRELSRVMALNGIYGSDITITGMDSTKSTTKAELEEQRGIVEVLYHRQKYPAYN